MSVRYIVGHTAVLTLGRQIAIGHDAAAGLFVLRMTVSLNEVILKVCKGWVSWEQGKTGPSVGRSGFQVKGEARFQFRTSEADLHVSFKNSALLNTTETLSLT
jgi:hypothetical protein